MDTSIIDAGLESAVLRLESGVSLQGDQLAGLIDEACFVRQVLNSLHARYDRKVVEQAAIAGALCPDVLEDPQKGPAAAAYIAQRLDAISNEFDHGWTGEVREGDYVFSRTVRGVTQSAVLDKALIASQKAKKLDERAISLQDVYAKPAVLVRNGEETQIDGPLTLLSAVHSAGHEDLGGTTAQQFEKTAHNPDARSLRQVKVEDAIEAFARQLADDVEAGRTSETGELYSEREFTKQMLDKLGEEGVIENATYIPEGNVKFGNKKCRITGFALPEDEERLLLVTTIYTGDLPPRHLTKDELTTAFREAVNFFDCSCRGLHDRIEPSNTDASDLARRISESHEKISVLRVIILSDAQAGLRSIDIKETRDGTRVVVDLYGIERIHKILGEGLTRDDIWIDFEAESGASLPCLKTSGDTAGYDAYLAAIPGSVLASVYEKYGTRLLELNVRAFLGLRGRKSVNAGLRKTILEEPQQFLAYNNGIVATVDDVDIEEAALGAIRIRSLRGLQIVNGGQTTASLHRARKKDSARLDEIMVPAKIIRVAHGDLNTMVAAVSRSANSQNTVQPADFSANDPFHIKVEGLANNTWLPDGRGRWFYERARGSYSAAELKVSFSKDQQRRFAAETPKDRRFAKTDLAKYLNAWDGYPHLVSFGNQKNFAFFMQALKDRYPAGFEPDQAWFRAYVAKAILFRSVLAIVKKAKFPAYQANIAAYTVSILAWKTGGRIDFEAIWAQQDISKALSAMLLEWVVVIDRELRKSAEPKMPSEWAKKDKCWEHMRDIALDIPRELPPELSTHTVAVETRGGVVIDRRDGLTSEDLALIAEVRKIEATTWFKVAEWGKKSKQIHWKLAGIAKTMGEYGLGDWERSPSAKQAKWAMEAFRTYVDGNGTS
ncbi:AIPR family protein [Microvirga soli]|uniref:AIPR family protein n=1 Tax=Microvirga soli TaxID=1854496 RepID=UPI00191F9601|nr:AIPR family protein [Microvirga soli]